MSESRAVPSSSDASPATAVTVDTPAAGVLRLRIGNVSHRGALSAAVLAGLEDGVRGAGAEIRCLILAGSGTTFSAGYDLTALGSPPDPQQADGSIAPDRVRILELLDDQPLPVIAAVNGPALGGGLELLLACDLRVATPAASLSAPAGRLGLVYSPAGLERIAAEVPWTVAADLFLAGGTISAERALELGLYNELVPAAALDARAVALATAVVRLAPLSVRANRVALRALRRRPHRLSGDDRERLLDARAAGMASDAFAEGIAAFQQHRSPSFEASSG